MSVIKPTTMSANVMTVIFASHPAKNSVLKSKMISLKVMYMIELNVTYNVCSCLVYIINVVTLSYSRLLVTTWTWHSSKVRTLIPARVEGCVINYVHLVLISVWICHIQLYIMLQLNCFSCCVQLIHLILIKIWFLFSFNVHVKKAGGTKRV